MLYMIIEHYRNGDAIPAYRRFRVTPDLTTCYQVMETPERPLPVITSTEAAASVAGRL